MRISLFSGTSEGKEIAEYLNSKKIYTSVFVATEYGKEVMNDMNFNFLKIHIGRLGKNEIIKYIKDSDLVIDATHPYAEIVTQNIQIACETTGVEYIRLLREENKTFNDINSVITFAENIEQAAEFLKSTDGNIFVSTGIKDLHKYCDIKNYKNRITARVLPLKDSIKKCDELGLKKVIYKKGPFSHTENTIEFKKHNIKWLVTKNSGKAGGFDEKISAAKSLGINTIIIKRPPETGGLSMEQVKKLIDKKTGDIKENLKFPLFIDISDKNILVVGGGNIAFKRMASLLKFGAKIKVVSPEFDKIKIHNFENASVKFIKRKFEKKDLDNVFMVIGATNDRDVNHYIYKLCQNKNIFYSIADKKDECNFYFPAVCVNDKLSIGIVSDGNQHKLVKDTAEKIRGIINEREKNKNRKQRKQTRHNSKRNRRGYHNKKLSRIYR